MFCSSSRLHVPGVSRNSEFSGEKGSVNEKKKFPRQRALLRTSTVPKKKTQIDFFQSLLTLFIHTYPRTSVS